ncbi:MAG: hypothetical protein ABW221_12345 [Vicinamibacteria bacterium]
MSPPPSLDVVGPFRGSSGYDRHTREFVRGMARQGARIRLFPLEGWSIDLPEHARDPWFDGLTEPVQADTVLHFTMPPQARPVPGLRSVNYTMFEAERIPPAWASAAAQHDLVVVPTEVCRAAWVASGVPEQAVAVCPLGIDPSFADPAEPLALVDASGRAVSSYARRLLNVAELRPRKNHLGLIRCWARATTADDDAVLILKLTAFQPRTVTQFREDLMAMVAAYGLDLAQAAPIVFLVGFITDAELRSLYRTATHYVSLSHGEAWDQAMMEAIASGLLPVAPRHSAYVEYLTDADAELLPAAPVAARFEGRMGAEDRVFFDGLRWWEADEEAAAAALRGLVRGTAPPRPSPRDRILSTYGWDRASVRLLGILS